MIVHDGWELQPEKCRVDLDFIEFIKSYNYNCPLSILHMGPGLHHSIGQLTSDDHTVISITNSIQEMEAFCKLQTEGPPNTGYHCMFDDIYTAPLELLGPFDYVTLFHLEEAPDPVRDRYARYNTERLLQLAREQLCDGQGSVVTYNQSSAYGSLLPKLRSGLTKVYTTNSLDFWR